MSRDTEVLIDSGSLKHNLSVIKSRCAAATKLMAVIKANAYGHGIIEAARAFEQSNAFAVAHLDEAMVLRNAGIEKDILLLEGVFDSEELQAAAEAHLSIVIQNAEQLGWLETTPLSRKIKVWLKVDTGMHRLGVSVDESEMFYARLCALSCVSSVTLMSHFACADEPDHPLNQVQINQFQSSGVFIHQVRPQARLEAHVKTHLETHPEKSMANSAALFAFPEVHFDWVRPGISLYGASPDGQSVAEQLGLKAAMHFRSKVIAVKKVLAGGTVGYGATWRAPADTVIAVIAAGYGDGYPRHVRANTPVVIRGCRAPIVGRVSMDLITVDVSALDDVELGDRVTLWGPALPVDEVAQCAGTISYELLCQVTTRVKRIFVP